MIIGAAPLKRKTRISSEDAWPLRNADGLTFAQAKTIKPPEPPKPEETPKKVNRPSWWRGPR